MNGILDVIRGLLISTKKIDLKRLPSQGIFYFPDFTIKIKKAELEDILKYEWDFDPNNLISVINCIKNIVKKNTIISSPYLYEHIKSVDLIFIFLEIVKFTKDKEIVITIPDEVGQKKINFSHETFHYFNFDGFDIDSSDASISIDGYKFSLPSVGVEDCLTSFLTSNIDDDNKWDELNYDFIFFCGNKWNLTESEIKNLITIFNFDLDDIEKSKISNIVEKFMGIINYTIKLGEKKIPIKNGINLRNIWK